MKVLIKTPMTNVYSRPSDKSEVVTQAVFATEVEIIGENDFWYQVQIPVQQNYTGWVKKEVLFFEGERCDGRKPLLCHPCYFEEDKEGDREPSPRHLVERKVGGDREPSPCQIGKVVVRKHSAGLKNAPAINAEKIMELPINSRLWVLQKQRNWYEIWLPEGKTAWLQAEDVFCEKALISGSRATGEYVLDTARSFLGVPYLWGGLTARGIDCSGLVYTVYALCGINLHRDADLQYKYDGFAVNREDVCPGDLVFFYEDVIEEPTHVGIYEADQIFINASSKQNAVVRYSLLENNWRSKISGLKRILLR